jgi:hypothetical protein
MQTLKITLHRLARAVICITRDKNLIPSSPLSLETLSPVAQPFCIYCRLRVSSAHPEKLASPGCNAPCILEQLENFLALPKYIGSTGLLLQQFFCRCALK